jgi:putative acetyltransferase
VTVSGEVRIALESPRQASVMRLIEALDAYQRSLYPPESNHFLDIEALAAATVRFFVARTAGQPVGCCALLVSGLEGELKRLWVDPAGRGHGLGRRLVSAVEQQARQEGLRVLRLETGIHQPEALGLYQAEGYRACDAFAPYLPDPLSVFMEKRLQPA